VKEVTPKLRPNKGMQYYPWS